jgi:hypothetical protein
MGGSMIKSIVYSFPNDTSEEKVFFTTLLRLLSELPNKTLQNDAITLYPTDPLGALPTTTFQKDVVSFPKLSFVDGENLALQLGNFCINTQLPDKPKYISSVASFQREDSLGHYTELQIDKNILFRLSLEELYKRLRGHIVRIDHTGISIPSVVITKKQWSQYISTLAKQTAIYRYPTGEDWPFILPTTEKEFSSAINYFPIGREPKFELVFDTYSPIPLIQIDIETDLTRKEVTKLFSKPYGVGFPGLSQYFRAVYVHHPWPGLDIRCDIRYKNTNPGDDWQTGKWLVEDGGRI